MMWKYTTVISDVVVCWILLHLNYPVIGEVIIISLVFVSLLQGEVIIYHWYLCHYIGEVIIISLVFVLLLQGEVIIISLVFLCHWYFNTSFYR